MYGWLQFGLTKPLFLGRPRWLTNKTPIFPTLKVSVTKARECKDQTHEHCFYNETYKG